MPVSIFLARVVYFDRIVEKQVYAYRGHVRSCMCLSRCVHLCMRGAISELREELFCSFDGGLFQRIIECGRKLERDEDVLTSLEGQGEILFKIYVQSSETQTQRHRFKKDCIKSNWLLV